MTKTQQGRTSANGGNGNVRDSSAPGGAQHAAIMGAHSAAVNDLRPATDRVGLHRKD